MNGEFVCRFNPGDNYFSSPFFTVRLERTTLPFRLFTIISTTMNLYRWRGAVLALWVGGWLTPVILCAQTSELSTVLQSLYAEAEAHNTTLQSLEAAVREAEMATDVARSALLPDVAADVSVSYLGNATLWNRKFGEQTTAKMPHFGNNLLLRASQTLYSGGAIRSQVQLARQNQRMAEYNIGDGRRRVQWLIAGLYLQMHIYYNSQMVYARNAELAEQQIRLMRHRRDVGMSLRNDVTRYELQLQQLRLGEVNMRDRRDIVSHQLATTLGGAVTDLPLLDDSAFDDSAIAVSLESEWQGRARLEHVDLQKSALGIDISRTRERLERAAYLPKVSLIAENHLDGPITIEVPPIDRNLNYWFVGVGIHYDISSLYKNRRRVRRARQSVRLAEDRHAEVGDAVSDAVHTAYVELSTARTELEVRRTAVRLAMENYDVVSRRYENGTALVTDLTDAANMKLDAELALVSARIQLVYCYYQLRYSAGIAL